MKKDSMNIKRIKTNDIVEVSLFCTIIFIMAFTPIGYIPIGPFKATTLHIPVIILSIIGGVKKGTIAGLVLGLTSFINNTFISPTPLSFIFTPFYENALFKGNLWSLVICFLPRVLTGVTPFIVYKFIVKFKNIKYKFILPAIIGSLTNTILVFLMIYLFFGEEYLKVTQSSNYSILNVISYSIFTNGLLEAIISAIIVSFVCNLLRKNLKNFKEK